jgi:hypothetical protein
MTKTIKDYFKEFEDKVVSIQSIYSVGIAGPGPTRYYIYKSFSLVKGFIKAQHNLKNQRDLWLTIIDLLKDSKVFDDEIKEEIRWELLEIVSIELENLNKYIIRLQLHAQKNKTNKPDAKFNWQGEQTQLVYLIEQLYKQGFLSPISQAEKHRLTAQHFTVKGKSLNQKNLANTRRNSLNTKKGKPKRGEEIEQIISAAQKQNA